MDSKQIQTITMEMLIKYEETVGQLYRAYASKFPEYKDFWTKLADEEISHAAWIRQLYKKTEKGLLYFDEGRFNTVAIQTFLNYLNSELSRVNDPSLQVINALSISLYIEEALIERKFFEIFETDSVELKKLLHDLYASTEEHVNLVKDTLENYKQKQV